MIVSCSEKRESMHIGPCRSNYETLDANNGTPHDEDSPSVFTGDSQVELLASQSKSKRWSSSKSSKIKKKVDRIINMPSSLSISNSAMLCVRGTNEVDSAAATTGKAAWSNSRERFHGPEIHTRQVKQVNRVAVPAISRRPDARTENTRKSNANGCSPKVPNNNKAQLEGVWQDKAADHQILEVRSPGDNSSICSFPLLSRQAHADIAEKYPAAERKEVRFASHTAVSRAPAVEAATKGGRTSTEVPWDEPAGPAPSPVAVENFPTPSSPGGRNNLRTKSILRQTKFATSQKMTSPSNNSNLVHRYGMVTNKHSPILNLDKHDSYPETKQQNWRDKFYRDNGLALPSLDCEISYPDPPITFSMDDESTAVSNRHDFIHVVAAVVIQTAARRFLAKLFVNKNVRKQQVIVQNDQKRVHKHFDAAIRIQSAFRGFWVRDCIKVDHYCASTIQSVFRGFRSRSQYCLDYHRIIIIQKAWRRKMARKETARRNANTQFRQARSLYLSKIHCNTDAMPFEKINRPTRVHQSTRKQQDPGVVFSKNSSGFNQRKNANLDPSINEKYESENSPRNHFATNSMQRTSYTEDRREIFFKNAPDFSPRQNANLGPSINEKYESKHSPRNYVATNSAQRAGSYMYAKDRQEISRGAQSIISKWKGYNNQYEA